MCRGKGSPEALLPYINVDEMLDLFVGVPPFVGASMGMIDNAGCPLRPPSEPSKEKLVSSRLNILLVCLSGKTTCPLSSQVANPLSSTNLKLKIKEKRMIKKIHGKLYILQEKSNKSKKIQIFPRSQTNLANSHTLSTSEDIFLDAPAVNLAPPQ